MSFRKLRISWRPVKVEKGGGDKAHLANWKSLLGDSKPPVAQLCGPILLH